MSVDCDKCGGNYGLCLGKCDEPNKKNEFDYQELDRLLLDGLRKIVDEESLRIAIGDLFCVFMEIEDIAIRVYVMDIVIRHLLDARNHHLKELEEEDAIEERFRKESY